MARKPIACANWKMSMTVAESLAWVQEFRCQAGDLLDDIDVIICPPFTALWPTAQALRSSRIQLCAQNMAATTDRARMGQISAALLVDAGCQRVALGHWEVRRYLGEDDLTVNRKVHLALDAGLAPIVTVGEAREEKRPVAQVLPEYLENITSGCSGDGIATMIFVYEPEAAIGVTGPIAPERAIGGCKLVRNWLGGRWGDAVADHIRILYGRSVAPEYVADLIASPDVDGTGATRRGRNASTFAGIVRETARVKLDPNKLP